MRIGYLGPAGSHSHSAAELFVQRFTGIAGDSSPTLLPLVTLAHILDAVEEKALEIGCVPVENALEGSVSEVLDSLALRLKDTRIVGEFIRPVQHALIRKYEFMEGIQFIHSHPQAIGQCREALYALLGRDIKFVPTSSTSEAVKSLLSLDETHAALGSCQAAKHYGLEVLVPNIGELTHNATRFLLLSAHPNFNNNAFTAKRYKTSLCIGLHQNKPGALLEILTLLARFELNMSKIESRPTKKSLGEYLFYLDIEGALSAEAEAALQEQTHFYKCLGTYPCLGMLTDQPATDCNAGRP